jgi:hypothetical protein
LNIKLNGTRVESSDPTSERPALETEPDPEPEAEAEAAA